MNEPRRLGRALTARTKQDSTGENAYFRISNRREILGKNSTQVARRKPA
ncbi:MAG: hypothetical protein OXF20_04500 [Gammaproteobacteria bacterium]|nr:hypothetical protein [Gammaproteobacteria bacterium]